MTYDGLSAFIQTWGLVAMMVAFVGIVTYALWPGNKAKFRAAARMPLEED